MRQVNHADCRALARCCDKAVTVIISLWALPTESSSYQPCRRSGISSLLSYLSRSVCFTLQHGLIPMTRARPKVAGIGLNTGLKSPTLGCSWTSLAALADLGALASTTVWMNKHLLTCCDTSPLRLENGCDEWAGRPQSLRGDLLLHQAVRIKEVTQSWRATKAFAPTRQATDDVAGAGSGPHPWRWPPKSKGGQVGEARQPFLFFGYQPHSRSRQRWESCPPRVMPLS